MSKGRIGLILTFFALLECSTNNPQTIVLDREVHHVGQDTISSWYIPLPEKDSLGYSFDLSDPEDSGFTLGFLYRGGNFLVNTNEDTATLHSDENDPYSDSLKEPFLSCWLELEADTAHVNFLRELIDSSGFIPCIAAIQENVLNKGKNTISFMRTGEDFMIGAIIFSNDEALHSLIKYELWKSR